MKQKFSLGAILSVAGGKLLCDIGEVFKILNFMTNDNLYTHQLPRVVLECRPYLLKQFNFLTQIIEKCDDINSENCQIKLAEFEMSYGKEFDVKRIPMNDHTKKELEKKLEKMVGKEKIIKIEIDG